jgi:hypothetical protein
MQAAPVSTQGRHAALLLAMVLLLVVAMASLSQGGHNMVCNFV